MHSPELQAKIALWRMKAAEGTMSLDDWKSAVADLREGRMAASLSSASSTRKQAIKEIPKAADLLDELDGL